MNMIKLINLLVITGLFLILSPVIAQTEFFNHFAQLPWPEDEGLREVLEYVWASYPHTEWSGPLQTSVPVYIAEWDKYRDAVMYILDHDQELNTHGYIMVYYLKRIPHESWIKDGLPRVERFLELAKGRDDLKYASSQALETLFCRGTKEHIARYLRVPEYRKQVQDFLTSIWTPEALNELKNFLNEVKEKATTKPEWLAIQKDLEKSIATITKRQTYATLPREDIPPEFFEKEGKRQYEESLRLTFGCRPHDWDHPPDYHDGANHIIKYWNSYRLGAYYLLENTLIDGMKFTELDYVLCVLCNIHTDEVSEILRKLMLKCETIPGVSYAQFYITACYIWRITVEELNTDFKKHLVEDSEDTWMFHLYTALGNRFGEIGNRESIEILKNAKEYYRKPHVRDPRRIQTLKRAIEAIEQRHGLASAEDSDSSDTP